MMWMDGNYDGYNANLLCAAKCSTWNIVKQFILFDRVDVLAWFLQLLGHIHIAESTWIKASAK